MENVDISLVDWSRAQFALTAIYHWLFVPLTLGLSIIIAIMESVYAKNKNPEWKRMTKFWMKLFAVNFAIGVATGIILEFEFGTNWSTYSWMVGDIFGAPLAVEGLMAFFIEATFFVVMFFGWNKVSKGFHLLSTWMVAIGSNLSAYWILVANAWMQKPVGTTFNPDSVRNEMLNFWDVAFSPFATVKFFHTVMSGCVVASAFVIGVGAWYLLKNREEFIAKKSIFIAAIFGLVASFLVSHSGDISAKQVAKVQPMKLAAMEGLYEGKNGAGLIMVGIVNGSKTIDNKEDPFLFKIEVPNALSMMCYNNPDAFVPGINDIIFGNKFQNIASAADRIKSGKDAISALSVYKYSKSKNDTTLKKSSLKILNENYKNFGYGYISDVKTLIPSISITFYSFHLMVGFGTYLMLFFALILFLSFRKIIDKSKVILRIAIWSIPVAYIASTMGWIVAEVGRQPWVIQDLLSTSMATSNLQVSSVKLTFVILAVIFTALLIADVKIILNQIKQGPKE